MATQQAIVGPTASADAQAVSVRAGRTGALSIDWEESPHIA